jgi:hypothetical protein
MTYRYPTGAAKRKLIIYNALKVTYVENCSDLIPIPPEDLSECPTEWSYGE